MREREKREVSYKDSRLEMHPFGPACPIDSRRARFPVTVSLAIPQLGYSLGIRLLILALGILFICFAWASVANADAYYVDPISGDDSTGAANDPSQPFRRLRALERLLKPGDIAFLREGLYNDSFWPASSGTPDAPITIEAFPGESPILTGAGYYDVIVNLGWSGKSYFVIDGLHFDNVTTESISLNNGASHNMIRNCRFTIGRGYQIMSLTRAHYNVIENNFFDTIGTPADAGGGEHIFIKGSSYNLIQDNFFTRAGHYMITLEHYLNSSEPSFANVVRNNRIEQHWGGGIGIGLDSHHNVIEKNQIYYVGEEVTGYPKTGIQLRSDGNIIRKNVIAFSSMGPYAQTGISLEAYDFRGKLQHCRDNRIYHNAIYKCGMAALYVNQRDDVFITGNWFVNNIVYHNKIREDNPYFGRSTLVFDTYHSDATNKWAYFANENFFFSNIMLHADFGGDRPGYDSYVYYSDDGIWEKSLDEVEGEYPDHFSGNLEVNPGFINADEKDFRLQEDSPAIDAGRFLTHTTAAGVVTRFVPVRDVRYFCDGFGIVPGDRVQVGLNRAATVVDINESAGVLELSVPLSFAEGDPVSLAYEGLAPDVGALELGESFESGSGAPLATGLESWNDYR